jgi:hypothetical protein
VFAPWPAGTIPTNNACGGVVRAFAYAALTQQVIVLCSDSDKGALISSLKNIDQWRTAGDLKVEKSTQQLGVEVLGLYLSTMILHELMQVASFAEQLKLFQPAQCKHSPSLAN